MVDLGVYNFVKNAVAAGKSEEDITADLARGGLRMEIIEEALAAVQSGAPPAVKGAPPTPVIDIGVATRASEAPVHRVRGVVLVIKLALLFALLGGMGVFLWPWLSDLQVRFQGVREKYEAGRLHVSGDPTPLASTQ